MPESTVAILEMIASKGSRSTFINEAIQVHAKSIKQNSLHEQLKKGAIARAERNLQMAEEWAALEDEVWQKYL